MAVIITGLIIVKVTVITMSTDLITSSIMLETMDITMGISIITIIQRGMVGDIDWEESRLLVTYRHLSVFHVLSVQ
jgi:hypothetical protein